MRRRWLLKRFAELAVVLSAMLLLVTQFVAPTVRGTLEPFERLDVASLVERLMALAIPTLFVWILMFVALFELWLSIVAEVTRFVRTNARTMMPAEAGRNTTQTHLANEKK